MKYVQLFHGNFMQNSRQVFIYKRNDSKIYFTFLMINREMAFQRSPDLDYTRIADIEFEPKEWRFLLVLTRTYACMHSYQHV